MYIVIIAWGYVVLMMSITETSVVAGVMTFFMYGVMPLTIILYLSGGKRRRQRRMLAKREAASALENKADPLLEEAGTRAAKVSEEVKETSEPNTRKD